MSLKALARKVIERETVGETILPTEPKKDSLPAPETPEGEKSVRSLIEELLAEGPRPYAEILAAVGGNEDALREAIRGWAELTAYDSGEEWFWELQPATATIANFATDPVSIGERIGIKYEQEIPESLGKPIFWHKGTPLAYENDPPHIKLYAWATVSLSLSGTAFER